MGYKSFYDYEHTAGCVRVALKIRREYFHVALMTASLLSTILKTTRTQPALLATCDLLRAMKVFCEKVSKLVIWPPLSALKSWKINRTLLCYKFYPRKISWARIYSARYWFHSALKKSKLHPFG